MKSVEKVAISIPCDVYRWVEAERDRRSVSRSQLVTSLLREEIHRQEIEARAKRYEEAYRRLPETDEERTWADWSAQNFWDLTADLEKDERRIDKR